MQTLDQTAAVTAILASAFKLAHLDDEAAERAADNTTRYLKSGPILVSDPTETRAQSETAKDGMYYVTDGVSCTCKARLTWCKHRVAHRFALARLALTDPATLVRLIQEQAVPLTAAEPEIAVGPRIASVIRAATAELDDVAYLTLIVSEADYQRAMVDADQLFPPR
jgi:hypothetical protein